MRLFQVYYDAYGDEMNDLFASEERPTEKEVLRQLVDNYGVHPDQTIEIFEITHVHKFGTEREEVKVNVSL